MKKNIAFLSVWLLIFLISTQTDAQILTTWPCHAVSEDANTPNYYFRYDPATNTWFEVGGTGTQGFNAIEAIAYDPVNDILYAYNDYEFGYIDQATGTFISINPNFLINENGEYGIILLDDIDGLSYDPVRNVLWATHRFGGLGDVLFQVDPATGTIIPDAFGTGIDYVVVDPIIDPVTGLTNNDVDDIAYNPYTGVLYAIQNETGTGGALTTIDLTTGTPTIIGSFGVDDMEGLGITYLGELYGTTGDNGPDPNDSNHFYYIDETTGLATQLIPISSTRVDFESFDCFSSYNDLALTKQLSSSQTTPIYAGDQVTFDITVINQGNMPVTNVALTDYIPTGLTLSDATWTMTGATTAETTLTTVLNPGDSAVIPITFTVDPTFAGSLTNQAEISGADFTDGTNTVPVGDIDGSYDQNPNNDNVVDDMVDEGGPAVDEDEDDHDIATVTIECLDDPVEVCDGQPINVELAGGDGFTMYQWYKDGVAIAGETNQIYIATDVGTYTYTVDDAGPTGDCVGELCCPIVITTIECCPPVQCIPITVIKLD